MKHLFSKSAKLVGWVAVTIAGYAASAASVKITPPDAGLIASVDSQSTNVTEGIVFGDFETWYPGLYPGYRWARETVEALSNGLFQMNYVVLDKHNRTQDELSILRFRPQAGSPAGRGFEEWGDDSRARPAKLSASAGAVEAIEEVFFGAQMFVSNLSLYAFRGSDDEISLVSRLPRALTGRDALGDFPMRRVRIFLEQAGRGLSDLVMEHAPYLVDTTRVSPTRRVLADNVSMFHLEYWDWATSSWREHSNTNVLPAMVRVTVGTGKMHRKWESPQELTSRIVALPATGVLAIFQRGGTGGHPGSPRGTNRPPRGGDIQTNPFDDIRRARDTGPSQASSAQGAERRSGAERRKARNADHFNTELHWLGWSGVELAKYILAADLQGPSGQMDSLAEQWAGGPGIDTNAVDLPTEIPLGAGQVSIRIVDHERKFNINVAGAPIMRQALTLIAIDPLRQNEPSHSLFDWIDSDNDPRQQGAESDYYLRLSPPYFAKNGAVDDLAELLLVRGMTREMYYGRKRSDEMRWPGLIDLFTALSSRTVNINTASETTLQLLPPIDVNVAAAIIQRRSGLDGIDGTQDDTPFRNPQELGTIPGLASVMQQIQPYVTVRSAVFEVHVQAEVGGARKDFVAVVYRNNPRSIQVLSFHAK